MVIGVISDRRIIRNPPRLDRIALTRPEPFYLGIGGHRAAKQSTRENERHSGRENELRLVHDQTISY
jgi:hypothetical protein